MESRLDMATEQINRRRGRLVLSAIIWATLTLAALLYSATSRTDVALAHGDDDHAPLAGQSGTIPPPLPAGMLFQADLSPANEVNAPDSLASGRSVMALISDTLYMRIMVSDIDNITAAHIHEAAPNSNGPVVFPLYAPADGVFDPTHPITATVTLNAAQLAALKAGSYYINIHTTEAPAGELRGQVRPYIPPNKFHALMLGGNEAPQPVTTTLASGVAYFTLVSTDTLQYELHVSDIVSITASHIHRAPAGKAGPVVQPLYSGIGLFDPTHPISGSVVLNGADLVDLLTNFLYVNVHTAAHPAGEIRGQIGGASIFAACLNGAQEVPAQVSAASGNAVAALDADGKTLVYRVMVNDIQNITMAHIHKGERGANGAVLATLYNGSGAFDAMHPISGTVSLSPQQVMEMITGKYYINVHTAKVGSGEIRGQIEAWSPGAFLNAPLLGSSQVPPEASNAAGLMRLTLSDALDRLAYTVVVTDINGINAAHIHRGPAGVNGPVVASLFATGDPEGFSPSNPIGGGVPLSAQGWVDLLTGYFYANVHTAAHLAGEIRGQIGSERLFASHLVGSKQVPSIATSASGHSVLALNDNATQVAYRLFVQEISNITMAHIHRGAAGVNGPPIVTMYNGVGAFDTSNPISGIASLSTADVLNLLAGRLYINVHTNANGAGEIRDQINPLAAPEQFMAVLSGIEEVPPVTTAATGVAQFRLAVNQSMLNYSVAAFNLNNARAAHIHVGPVGKNGPVAYGLFNAASGALFDATHPLGGCIDPSAVDLVDLLTGYWYVNAHTTTNPNGEIRGQVNERTDQFLPIIQRN